MKVFNKVISAAIILIILLTGCFAKHEGWQTLELKNAGTDEKIGTLMIPGEWQCVYEDGYIYILDESGEPLMIEVDTEAFSGEEGASDKFRSGYKYIDHNEDSEVISNGALFGTVKILYEGEKLELLFLELPYPSPNVFPGDAQIEFLVWDKDIDRDMLREIAKTYAADYAADLSEK